MHRQENQQNLKRRRALVACERCQHRKKKCDGAYPKCGSCKQVGIDCHYNGAVSDQLVPNKECMDKIKRLEREIVDLKSESTKLKSELESCQANQKYGGGEFFRSISNLIKKPSDQYNFTGQSAIISKVQTVRRILTNDEEINIPVNLSSKISIKSFDDESTDYSQNTELVDSFAQYYLNFSGNRYHFIEKSVVQELIKKEPEKRDKWESFLVLIILANGCKITELSRLTTRPSSRYYFDKSLEVLSEVEQLSPIDQIKAIMLIALFLHYSYDGSSKFIVNVWELSGMAIRKLVQLGLHRKQSLSPDRSVENELNKRLFWSVYAFDRLLCLSLGRPYSLSDRDIDIPYPLSLENPYEDQNYLYNLQLNQEKNVEVKLPVTTMTYLIETCKVRSIEGDINSIVYQESDSALDETYEILSERLENWLKCTPSRNEFNEGLNKEVTHDYILLLYYRAKLSLLLPIVLRGKIVQNNSDVLQEAFTSAGGICRCFKKIHKDAIFGYSIFSLHTIFFAGVMLVYCVWRLGNSLSSKAHNDIRACSNLLYSFSERTQEAETYRYLFENLIDNVLYKSDLSAEGPVDQDLDYSSSGVLRAPISNSPHINETVELLNDNRLLHFTFEDFLGRLNN